MSKRGDKEFLFFAPHCNTATLQHFFFTLLCALGALILITT